jgi:hypothetical protein
MCPNDVSYPGFYLIQYSAGGNWKGGVGSLNTFFSTTLPLFTTWKHYALVYNGGLSGNSNRLKFYENAIQITGLDWNGTIPATTPEIPYNFKIGFVDTGHTFGYSNGSIGNVRLYNRVLTIGEVAADKAGILLSGCVGNWPLGMASPEPDYSGNGYAGTLVNAPPVTGSPPVMMPFRHGKTYHWTAPVQDHIDGEDNYVIDKQYEALSIHDGAVDNWYILSNINILD